MLVIPFMDDVNAEKRKQRSKKHTIYCDDDHSMRWCKKKRKDETEKQMYIIDLFTV